MSDPVQVWWLSLVAIAALNVGAWSLSARLLPRTLVRLPVELQRSRRALLWLSAGYVAGCAFRSVLPMVDVPRICLYDSPVSYIAVGRTVATLAELCFAAQFAILLREAGAGTRMPWVSALGGAVVPLIVLAEAFSWSAVLTTNNLLHAVENALWAVTAVLVMAGFAAARTRFAPDARRVADAILVAGAAYVAYMALVDVPMYHARWRAGLAAGHELLPVAAGIAEIVQRCTPTRDWAAWRGDVDWLTLYFSVAVWISIALAHAPALQSAQRASGSAERRTRRGAAGRAAAIRPRT